MSAGSISLQSAIRTCDVNVAWANRIESDRFLNPSNMLCPIWSGVDSTGREVCVDSFKTKRAGCNSALDRVDVENNLRPQYSEYVNLQALGIDGPSMSVDGSSQNPSNMHTKQVGADVKMRNYVSSNSNPNGAPSFGNQFKEARPRCANYPMEGAMSNK